MIPLAFRKYTYPAAAILLGFVTGLGLSFSYLWILSVVGLFGILVLLDRIPLNSWGGVPMVRALFSFSFIGTAIVWFWWTLPLEWLGSISLSHAVVLVFIYWALTVAVLAFFVYCVLFLFEKYRRGAVFDVLLLAFLWVFFEYVRTWGFALYTLGGASLFGPHFSVGFLGYAVAAHNLLLQAATWGGVYTLSFFGALAAGGGYWLYQQKTIHYRGTLLLMFFALLYVSGFVSVSFFAKNDRGVTDTTKVALITTDFKTSFSVTSEEREQRFSTLQGLVQEAAAAGAQIIVLPEDARFMNTAEYIYGDEFANIAQEVLKTDRHILLIDSSRVQLFWTKDQAQISYFDTITGETVVSRKSFLVPQGEYTPYLFSAILKLAGQQELLDRFERGRAYSKSDILGVGEYNDVRVGALFCSEILSPHLYTKVHQEFEPDVLVNVASQSLFHQSGILFHQMQAIARVHAVQNKTWFLQASNGARSFAVDGQGTVFSQSSSIENSVLYVELPI